MVGGTLSALSQDGQRSEILLPDAAVDGCGVGAAAGICMTFPQVGHFPFLPAESSGHRILALQLRQLNSIGMESFLRYDASSDVWVRFGIGRIIRTRR
jgi:hypothetical protein